MTSAEYCTCTHLKCPFHPTNHDKGCTPCIEKNLKLNEIPNCFFDKIPGAENRLADHFEDFAHAVLKAKDI